MKIVAKILVVVLVLITIVSCTDQTTEHENFLSETQSIDKEDAQDGAGTIKDQNDDEE